MNKIFKLVLIILILIIGLGVVIIVNFLINYLVFYEFYNRVGYSYKKIEILLEKLVFGVDLLVYKDIMKGWNLELKIINFKFVLEMVN